MVRRAIAEFCRKHEHTNIDDVIAAAEKLELQSRSPGWKVTALRVLNTLGLSGLSGKSFGASRASGVGCTSTDQKQLVKTLLKGGTIVGLNGLYQSAKKFLVHTLILWLYYVMLASPRREKLDLVVFVGEAHNLKRRIGFCAAESTGDSRVLRRISMTDVVELRGLSWPMRLLSDSGVRRIIHGVAMLLGQAYQLARARLAGLGSPVWDRLLERDHLITEIELSSRETAILPAQREAILQLMKLRGWSFGKRRIVSCYTHNQSEFKEIESGRGMCCPSRCRSTPETAAVERKPCPDDPRLPLVRVRLID